MDGWIRKGHGSSKISIHIHLVKKKNQLRKEEKQMKAYERLLNYVVIYTTSDESLIWQKY